MGADEKRQSFDRARQLLVSGNDDILRYVCLELRLTLEAMVYMKLRAYASRIPPSILDTWQPPQALRALKEFEPLADENFTIRISPESSPGVPTGKWQWIGEHKTLRLAKLRKLYNKLGSHLHLPSPKQNQKRAGVATGNASVLRTELQAICAELAPIVANDFDATLAEVITFACLACGKPSVVNANGAEKSERAICLQENCGAHHYVRVDGDSYELKLVSTDFDCAECGAGIPIENRFLDIGHQFKCPKCGTRHQVAGRQWQYGIPIEDENIVP